MKSMKESLKSLLLIILIATSLILTQLTLTEGFSINEGSNSDIDAKSIKLSTYINPQSYFISFGGLSYTRVYDHALQDSIWGEIRPFILSCFMNYETLEEIKRVDYIKAFSDSSILVRMPLELSVENYSSVFSSDGLKTEIASIIPYEYILREGNVRSLYVYDRRNNKYYLMKHKTQMHDIASLIAEIKTHEWVEYRKLSDRFSLAETVDSDYNQLNYELVPFVYDYNIKNLVVSNEVRMDEVNFMSDIHNISTAVFGNRMDFVKRLKDVNDSIILMYGYGDKSLTVSTSGNITFQKKFVAANKKKLDFKVAFELAAGRVESFGIVPDGLYLADYNYQVNSETHFFYFNYKLNSYPIAEIDSQSYPIIVKVVDDQIVNVEKDIKIIVEIEKSAETQSSSRLLTINDCITNNFLEVSIYYLQDNNIYDNSLNTIQYYYPIRSEISSIDMRYYYTQTDDIQQMIPVWQVVISTRTYLFNAYTGELIKTYR